MAVITVDSQHSTLQRRGADRWSPWRASAPAMTTLSTIALLAVLPIHDRLTRGRVHPVSLWGGVGVFVWFTAFFVIIAPTAAWQRFAERLVR